MATTHNVIDLITQVGQPVIKGGDFLQVPTVPAGNIQTKTDTDGRIPNGVNLFAIVGVGVATGGVYPQNNVYPVKIQGNAYVADTAKQPIIIQTAGKVVYQGGRNSKQKDVYAEDGIKTVTITTGQEPKELLKAFLAFASENFAFGVNQFEQGNCIYIAES